MIKSACLAEGESMSSAGERSRYLSLALDARRAINAIRAVQESRGDLMELRHSIGAAAASLDAVSSDMDLYAHLASEQCAPYRRFEEIQTVVEASTTFESGILIPSLKSLLASESPQESDLSVARKFFRALEGRALHHFNDPRSSDNLTF
jgi:hypothetical protein